MITGMHHAEIVVSDIDRSIAFYTDTLGLELVNRIENVSIEPPQAVGLDDREARVDIAFLKAGPDIIGIHRYRTPTGAPSRRRSCDPGVGHIAFTVDDIHKTYETLGKAGLKFFHDPLYIEEGFMKGRWWVYASDPDGTVIELVQKSG